MNARLALAVTAVLASACAVNHVDVTPAGLGVAPPPRPADCKIEFLRTRAPERAYDELATLHWKGVVGPESAQDAMREKACSLGAHAVVVTRDFVPATSNVPGLMTGTAIVYRGVKAADAGSVPMAAAASGAGKLPPQPPDLDVKKGPGGEKLLPARLRSVATLREGPFFNARDLGYIEARSELWAAEAVQNGYRLVLLTDGRTGYLQGSAIELVVPVAPVTPAPTPPAQKTAPPPPRDAI